MRASCEFIAKEPMELSVNKGDLVAIIKQQDPSGGGDRWYVDNGGESYRYWDMGNKS